jgi:hypothetical protein
MIDGAKRGGRVVPAALLAGTLSGIPSTAWALATGADPLAATYAAGRMLLPHETRLSRLIPAAAVVHGALSLGWTAVLARRPEHGLLAGALIAALDLGTAHLIGSRRFAGVRELPVLPQLADHLAFGVVATAALRTRGRAPSSAPRAVR